jgi:hypothetical protein
MASPLESVARRLSLVAWRGRDSWPVSRDPLGRFSISCLARRLSRSCKINLSPLARCLYTKQICINRQYRNLKSSPPQLLVRPELKTEVEKRIETKSCHRIRDSGRVGSAHHLRRPGNTRRTRRAKKQRNCGACRVGSQPTRKVPRRPQTTCLAQRRRDAEGECGKAVLVGWALAHADPAIRSGPVALSRDSFRISPTSGCDPAIPPVFPTLCAGISFSLDLRH